MKLQGFLFWQPRRNLLKYFSKIAGGYLLIFLNYVIWLILLFFSYLLVRHNPNNFWQLIIVTTIAEIIERYSKKHILWPRPMYLKNKTVPRGLVRSWYNTGSFPSGHTTKTVYFFLFLLQYHLVNPLVYLAICLPLIVFRVLAGFHYPIDILGGLAIGILLWFLTKNLVFPDAANLFIKTIFDTVFFIK
jgi:membrane-associated phospholipid phosphatase